MTNKTELKANRDTKREVILVEDREIPQITRLIDVGKSLCIALNPCGESALWLEGADGRDLGVEHRDSEIITFGELPVYCSSSQSLYRIPIKPFENHLLTANEVSLLLRLDGYPQRDSFSRINGRPQRERMHALAMSVRKNHGGGDAFYLGKPEVSGGSYRFPVSYFKLGKEDLASFRVRDMSQLVKSVKSERLDRGEYE